ncbi:tetratricopeptide repeat protein [Nonomuraea purpurea]|uniref:Tetratricopeptide repeat protein n=1 Tax=Nonomuraea purpurea TaxID=1849276 RepID=A0ABV8GDA8_9ACTN
MKTDDSIQRARTLLSMRRPADAERELRGVLATDPNHATAHCILALALVQQGGNTEAVAEAQEGIRLAPEHWFPQYTAGQVYYRLRVADSAIASAEASLALEPEETATWELLARANLLKQDFPRVVEAARRGLAIDPQDSDLVSLLSLAHTNLGETGPAMAAAAHAVQLDPESATAHLAAGRAALAAGEARRAAEYFREVLRLDPGFEPAREQLVDALKQRNPLYRLLSKLRLRFFCGWRMVLLLPVAPPLVLVFVLIAVLHWAAWVAESVTTLRLARAKATQLLFENAESRVAMACCAIVVAGVALLALGIGVGHDALGMAGVAVMALVTPVQEAAHTGSARGRVVLYGWTALLVATTVTGAVLDVPTVALLSVYAGLATIWVAAGVRRLFGARQL